MREITDLGTGTRQIRAKHNDPGRSDRELFSTGLETIFKELDIATTAVTALLILHLVLNDQWIILEVKRLGKGSRNGVVGGFAFRNQTLIALNDGNGRLFHLPLADITEGLTTDWGLFGGL